MASRAKNRPKSKKPATDLKEKLLRDKMAALARENRAFLREINECRRQEAQLDEIIRFEKLLSDLSSRLVHVPSERIGKEVEQGLRRAVEFLGVGRGSIYESPDDSGRFRLSHSWRAEGVAHPPAGFTEREFPWLAEKLRGGETTLVPATDDLPREAGRDRGSLKKHGIRAILVIPLAAGKKIFGAVTFASIRGKKTWPRPLVQRLRLVGEIFASALARKKAEEAARRKDRSLAEAQRIARLGNWDWNIAADELAWSDEVYRIFGLRPQQFGATYQAFLQSVHPEDRKRVREAVSRSLADPGVLYSIEHRVVRPDGSERVVHERGEVTFDGRGRAVHMIGTVHDITERKKAEEALRKSEAFNRDILSSLTDQIAIVDRQGLILAVNEAWERFAAENEACASPSVSPGADYLEVCRKAAREDEASARPALEGIQAVLEGARKTFQMEYPCDSPEEARWFLMKVMPLKRPGGGIVISHTNITERKRAEEALQRSEAQLRRLSSQLLSVQEEERKRIARELHDGIGQSLAAIKFSLESRVQPPKEGSPASPARSLGDFLPLIRNAIEEVRRIQTDLRPPILDDLGILATLSWFCREYQKVYSGIRLEKTIEIQEKEVPQALKTVIYRVLQEALNNVAKHSRASRALLSLRKEGDRIELLVEDRGPGFDLEKVLSHKGGEKGLGLSSMRERVELSGGAFSIRSARGKGTLVQATWDLNRIP